MRGYRENHPGRPIRFGDWFSISPQKPHGALLSAHNNQARMKRGYPGHFLADCRSLPYELAVGWVPPSDDPVFSAREEGSGINVACKGSQAPGVGAETLQQFAGPAVH